MQMRKEFLALLLLFLENVCTSMVVDVRGVVAMIVRDFAAGF